MIEKTTLQEFIDELKKVKDKSIPAVDYLNALIEAMGYLVIKKK